MLAEKFRTLLRTRLRTRWARDVIRKIESWKYLDRDIWDPEHGSQLIYQACQSGLPQAIGKLGSVELGAIRKYLRWCNHPQREELTALDRQILYTNAGVFPNDCHMLESFSVFMTRQVLPELTLIGVWFNLGEANVVKRYALATRRIAITSFESYWITQQPWTKALQGKRVLVVHPFEATIRAQYPYRLKIWMGREDVLPKFELLTMKVPQSPALITPRHASWFEALEDMQQLDLDFRRQLSDLIQKNGSAVRSFKVSCIPR